MSSVESVDDRAVGLTSLLPRVPGYRKLLVYLVLEAFLGGFIAQIADEFSRGTPVQAALSQGLLYGGAQGILLIALPALIASVLITTLYKPREFRKYFRHVLFAGVIAAGISTAGFAAGTVAFRFFGLNPLHVLLITNAIVLVGWLITLWVPIGAGPRSLVLCVVHPVLNLAFLVIGRAYTVLEPVDPVFLAVKFVLASLLLVLALGSFFFFINAPAKRNFGISSVQAATLFFAQWSRGSKGLEDVLAEMGETLRTYASAFVFRSAHSKAVKALFLVPGVHYGPVGNLGGSEFPFLLHEESVKKYNAPGLAFHSLTGPDFNPVYSSSVYAVWHELDRIVTSPSAEHATGKAKLLAGSSGNAHALGFAVGESAFLTLSRAPDNTEDVDWSIGEALRNRLLAKGFRHALVVDCHNCRTHGATFGPGSPEFFEYQGAIDGLKTVAVGELKMGVGRDNLAALTLSDGIGKGGLTATVFDIGGEKLALVLIDANNAPPSFYAQAHALFAKKGFTYAEFLTTDTHSVNVIGGVHNMLGSDPAVAAKILDAMSFALDDAMRNVEPVIAHAGEETLNLEVLGPKRSSEVTSTVSSIVATIKLLAPALFIGTIAVAFAALAFVKF